MMPSSNIAMIAICHQVFGEIDLAPILRRFRVVGMDDLPPVPQRQRVTEGSNQGNQRADTDVMNKSQFAAEIVADEVGFHSWMLV